MIAKQRKVSLWGDENVLKLTVVMAVQLYVDFKVVNCMVCDLQRNKTVFKQRRGKYKGE